MIQLRQQSGTHDFSRIAYHEGIQLSLYDRPAAASNPNPNPNPVRNPSNSKDGGFDEVPAASALDDAEENTDVARDCGIEMLDHRPLRNRYKHNYKPFDLEISPACKQWLAECCTTNYEHDRNKIRMDLKMQFSSNGNKVLLWSNSRVAVLHNADMLSVLQPDVDQLEVHDGMEMNLMESPGQLGYVYMIFMYYYYCCFYYCYYCYY